MTVKFDPGMCLEDAIVGVRANPQFREDALATQPPLDRECLAQARIGVQAAPASDIRQSCELLRIGDDGFAYAACARRPRSRTMTSRGFHFSVS